MNSIIPQPDGKLSPEHEALAAQVTEAELEQVDRALLSHATGRWQKVAYIVSAMMLQHPDLARELPDAFFAQRVYLLIELGKLEFRGFPGYMGFCEVRVPDAVATKEQPNH